MQRCRQAFTLIELAVVMVVLGVAAAVVLPRLDAAALGGARFERCANKLAALALHARNRAVGTATPHALHIDPGRGEYWIAPRPEGGSKVVSRKRERLPEGVSFEAVIVAGEKAPSAGATVVRFTVEGRADPAVVHLSGGEGRMKTVLITPLLGGAEVHDGRVNPFEQEAPDVPEA